jgi:acetoin utilization deacetylase AcuC-like enzyme
VVSSALSVITAPTALQFSDRKRRASPAVHRAADVLRAIMDNRPREPFPTFRHGNSTNQVFHASDEVLFASIHQSPLFPWTGPADDVGEGEGTGFTVNLPVPPGSGDEVCFSLIEHVVVPPARAFEPQLVLVSAGNDPHRDDPLADCNVTDHGFAAMAQALSAACESLAAPVGGGMFATAKRSAARRALFSCVCALTKG